MAFQLPTDVFDTCNGLLYCLSLWAFNVTSGVFWTMMLLGFCVTLFIATINLPIGGKINSFGFASLVGAIGALWFATLQLMPWWTASAFILTGGVGLVIMIMSQRS